MCPAEEETAAVVASATLRKEAEASLGQWAPKASVGHQDCKGSQGCRAAKVTRASEVPLGHQDPKEMWAQEVFLDSLELTEYPDIQARAGPEGGPAMMAAMGPGAMQAHRGPPAQMASLAHPGPKDPKDRKANLMHCLQKNVTNTGVRPESLDWSASRDLLATPGLWGQWVQLELQEDQDLPDLPGQKDSRATEGLVFMEKRVKRVNRACQDPMGFPRTPPTPLWHPQDQPSSHTRVKRAARANLGQEASRLRVKKGSWASPEHGALLA